MMGVPFPDIKPRLRMLDEAVRAIRALWTEDRVTLSGEFYNLKNAFIVPKPVQKPHPPIMLGGSGKGLLRIAAREADIVNIVSDSGRAGTILQSEVAKLTDEAFRRKIDFVRDEARAAGRDPDALTLTSTIFVPMLADTPEAARDFARMLGGMFGLDEMPDTPDAARADRHARGVRRRAAASQPRVGRHALHHLRLRRRGVQRPLRARGDAAVT